VQFFDESVEKNGASETSRNFRYLPDPSNLKYQSTQQLEEIILSTKSRIVLKLRTAH